MLDDLTDVPSDLAALTSAAQELADEITKHVEQISYDGPAREVLAAVSALNELSGSVARLNKRLLTILAPTI